MSGDGCWTWVSEPVQRRSSLAVVATRQSGWCCLAACQTASAAHRACMKARRSQAVLVPPWLCGTA